MAPIELTVPVVRASPLHFATTAHSSGTLLDAYFEHLVSESVQPPKKKRRTSSDDQTSESEGSICIADICVDLVFEALHTVSARDLTESQSTSEAQGAHCRALNPSDTVSVIVAQVSENAGHGWSITLRDSSSAIKSARLCIDLDETARDDAIEHLLNIAAASKWRDSSTSSSPIWCTTALERRAFKSAERFTLHSRIFHKTAMTSGKSSLKICRKLLDAYVSPSPPTTSPTASSPQMFYGAVHVPPKDTQVPDAVQHPVLNATLFPFQRRTVHWLLEREGARLCEDGSVARVETPEDQPSLSYERCTDALGQVYYASPLLGRMARDAAESRALNDHLRGGILSEEMGLGKTVEMVALMALNPRTQDVGKKIFDAYSGGQTYAARTTLIITPASILGQWKTELNEHAPSLKVFHYDNAARKLSGIRQTMMDSDVVLTTYAVLSREIWHAQETPDRSMRHGKKYEVTKSPLMKILWWRVCLDEAQMVESGVSHAATVARRIPRCNAWAISGTPVRKDVQDLCGLLVFLRYEPFCDKEVWDRLLKIDSDLFKEIFGRIALRHTKSQIKEDISLPPQKRITVTIPFTAVEEQHYGQLFEEMCTECGLSTDGGPLTGDWDPEDPSTVEKMRTWLVRLRQTCLHPEVGVSNRKALGKRTGPLRTVEEVLTVMIEQNKTALRVEERAMLNTIITQGHLHAFSNHASQGLQLYCDALKMASQVVEECRADLKQEQQKRQAGIASEQKQEADPLSETDDDSAERNDGLNAHRSRLRSALELEHACVFFAATSYFQLKSDTTVVEEGSEAYQKLEKAESAFYDQAKKIRKEILVEASQKCLTLMSKVSQTHTNRRAIPDIEYETESGGVMSRRILAEFKYLKTLLNEQAKVISEWRSNLTKLLTVELLDQDENVELTGDEYDETLKQQDQSYTYLFLLRALLTDRHEMVTGQSNFLAQHEILEASKAAKSGEGHDPQLTKIGLELRSSLRPDAQQQTSLRGLVADLRSVATNINDESAAGAAELAIVETETQHLGRLIVDQTKDMTNLTKELDLYRSTMNQRLEYYKQLQVVSDTVKPYSEQMSESLDYRKLVEQHTKHDKHSETLASLRTKARFLEHLRLTKDSGESRPCIICQSTFEVGVLTVCAHEFCKDCLHVWLAQHRSCPMCKRGLNSKDLHEITYKPRVLRAEEESSGTTSVDDAADKTKESAIYSSISQQTLDEIKRVDLPRSWSSKIDTIARHLLYLRASDPGAKSIVFSQYRDFLQVLGRALTTCKIGYSSISDNYGIQRFKQDSSVECFLLHAKAESSGLNLVNATHVFLCEPLINTAIELQAIARVHRIGQHRATTIWMYLIRDSVEESIYDISVARRLQHVHSTSPVAKGSRSMASRAATPGADTTEQELDAANTAELQSAPLSQLLTKGQSGGEMVRKDDLWQCLFAKGKRDGTSDSMREIEATMGRELRADAAEERRRG